MGPACAGVTLRMEPYLRQGDGTCRQVRERARTLGECLRCVHTVPPAV